MDKTVITKDAAKEQGLTRYYTGKPCRNGHYSERYTNGGGCCACLKDSRDKYHIRNREAVIERKKKWRKDNHEHVLQYREDTKHKRNEQCKAYRKKRYAECPAFRSSMKCRNLLYRTLGCTGEKKDKGTYDILGYSGEDLYRHMEARFQEGMSWENPEEWHIDHIHPVSRYVKEGVTEIAVINALSNLMPMWKSHNLEKGSMTLEEYLEKYPERARLYGRF